VKISSSNDVVKKAGVYSNVKAEGLETKSSQYIARYVKCEEDDSYIGSVVRRNLLNLH